MKPILLLLFLLITRLSVAQKPDADALMQEGLKLYNLEKASWYATDHFLANYPEKKDSLGGYLSYPGPDGHVYTIFFSRHTPHSVLVRYTFDSRPASTPLAVDNASSALIHNEASLIAIRQQALQLLNTNPGNFFSFYKNTSINPVPVITGKERKVYLLTAPQQPGTVLLGNDYLLEYNSRNELIRKTKLHNSLIELNAKGPDGQSVQGTIHSHVLSRYIEPTDICTLLLYKDYVEWSQHYVVHEDYISILDMAKEQLVIMPKKQFDKLSRSRQ